MENNVYLRSIPLILEDHENKLLKVGVCLWAYVIGLSVY